MPTHADEFHAFSQGRVILCEEAGSKRFYLLSIKRIIIMIIKIQHCFGHELWSILEGVTGIRYSENGRETSPADFMDEKLNSWEQHSVWHSRSDCSKIDRFNYLSYQFEGTTYHVLFDGRAYICNDEGKTIHKFEPKPYDGPVIADVDNRPKKSCQSRDR